MMETLKARSRLVVATSLGCTQISISPSFVAFPSCSSIAKAKAIHSIRCTSTRNQVVVADPDRHRLNNVATPWLMLPSETDDTTGEKLDCFYSLADGHTVRLNRKKSLRVPDTATCIASTMGWLGFVDTKDCSLYLSNPFLNDVVELPSLETLPSVLGVQRDPKTNDILKFKVCLSDNETLWRHNLDPYTMCKPEFMAEHITNLALSSADPRGCDTVVMAIQRSVCRRLAYCPISRQFTQDTDFDGFDHQFDPTCWTGLQEDYYPGMPYNQVVYDTNRGLFYAMFGESGIQAFDLKSDRGRRSKMVYVFPRDRLELQLKRALEKDGSEALKALRSRCKRTDYLVTLDNGDVLLIVRHFEVPKGHFRTGHKTLHFDVFRIVASGHLEIITCLNNDRAIFIGWNQSFCIKASSSPGVNPNCIYFADDDVSSGCYNVHALRQWGHDIGIFSMENGTITTCYPYHDEEEEKKVPLSAPLFWVAPLSSDYEYMARKHGVDDPLSRAG